MRNLPKLTISLPTNQNKGVLFLDVKKESVLDSVVTDSPTEEISMFRGMEELSLDLMSTGEHRLYYLSSIIFGRH